MPPNYELDLAAQLVKDPLRRYASPLENQPLFKLKSYITGTFEKIMQFQSSDFRYTLVRKHSIKSHIRVTLNISTCSVAQTLKNTN